MDRETSARVSTIASRILNMDSAPSEPGEAGADNLIAVEDYNSLLENAKIVAGSALVQDRTFGQEAPTFLDRVKTEHANLAEKHEALTLFLDRLNSGADPGVSPAHRSLLELQKSSMGIYRRVLEMRIEDLENDNG